jgi:ABC-2 type transport system permease protein
MNGRRIRTILSKEWEETIRNRTIVGTFLFMLLVFMGLPLVMAFAGPALAGDALVNDPDMQPLQEVLTQAFPEFAELEPVQQFQVFMLRQFPVLFLLAPIMGAMSVATYSIIGEKTTRSLEALLATPIRTSELLLAKSLAAAVPPVAATWVAFGIWALLVRLLGGPVVAGYALNASTWTMMLLIMPLVALLALGLSVIVSSRANDPRSAQQVAVILVLPIVALLAGQLSGLFLLGLPAVLIGAAVLLVVDALVLQAGVRLFNREAILTRWK